MTISDNKEKPLRLLVHAPLGIGGVTGMMLNIQNHIDREKLNFDYLVFHDRIEPCEHMVYKLGSRKIVASADKIRIKWIRGIVRLFMIRKVCKDNHFSILHFNGGASMGFLSMLAAKSGGVKYITFHSHNGGISNEGIWAKPVSAICKPLLSLIVDDFWACSDLAAQFSFPKKIVKNKKYYFIPNAIDLKKFSYNEEIRKEVRAELGLEHKFVIGHAGRFNHQKNHDFLIEIFRVIHKKDADAVLILFGVGELQKRIREKVHSMGLDDWVIFYGTSDEMFRMYQAMDVFLMPSKFEGMPITGVEAQAAALPIVFSDVITKEVQVLEDVNYVSLNEPPEVWADKVLSYKGHPRENQTNKLKIAGFDQTFMVRHFQDYYLEIGKNLNLFERAN